MASGKEVLRFGEDLGYQQKPIVSPCRTGITALGFLSGGTIRLWDVSSGKELRQFAGDQVRPDCWAFSPDGKILASGSSDKTIRLWDLATGLEQAHLDNQEAVWCLGWAREGKTLASGGAKGTIRLWDIAAAKMVHQIVCDNRGISRLAWTPDGKTLVSAGDGRVRLWDVNTGRKIGHLGDNQKKKQGAPGEEVDPAPELGFIKNLVLSHDGKMVFVALQDSHRIYRWDLASRKELPPLETTQDVSCLAVPSKDGKMLASAGTYALHRALGSSRGQTDSSQ